MEAKALAHKTVRPGDAVLAITCPVVAFAVLRDEWSADPAAMDRVLDHLGPLCDGLQRNEKRGVYPATMASIEENARHGTLTVPCTVDIAGDPVFLTGPDLASLTVGRDQAWWRWYDSGRADYDAAAGGDDRLGMMLMGSAADKPGFRERHPWMSFLDLVLPPEPRLAVYMEEGGELMDVLVGVMAMGLEDEDLAGDGMSADEVRAALLDPEAARKAPKTDARAYLVPDTVEWRERVGRAYAAILADIRAECVRRQTYMDRR